MSAFPDLLDVQDLTVDYGTGRGAFRALERVSLRIGAGECLGLVGESGSGKSTLGRAILGLAPVSAGRIRFDGRDIAGLSGRARRDLARDLQVIFQDPYGSLNPGLTIGAILAEPLAATGTPPAEAMKAVAGMLDRVRLPADSLERYPSEFSGGQRQRIAIARALVRKPRLVICDEPVSALDLTTQATVIDLLIELQRDLGTAYLFVSHDLGVVRRICHRVAVMRRGRIVETGAGDVMTRNPTHPYSQSLLLAAPVADPATQARRRARWLELRAATCDRTMV
jgi:ABC-type glutathione transport system ATPase component